jgi:hypothetical protein
MNSKVLVGAVIGGVVYFLLGWIIYGMLLMDTMANYFTCARAEDDMQMLYIIIGNLLQGLLLAYIFSKWASISTFSGGAVAGGTIGLLMALSIDCIMYATSTVITSPTGIIIDAVIVAVMSAIAGGVIGWWLGRK